MSDIIQMSDYKPHLSGTALCLECRHEWEAVAPLGTVVLECPECNRITAVMKNSVIPNEYWMCNCDNALFFLTEDGPMCRKCGIHPKDYENGTP